MDQEDRDYIAHIEKENEEMREKLEAYATAFEKIVMGNYVLGSQKNKGHVTYNITQRITARANTDNITESEYITLRKLHLKDEPLVDYDDSPSIADISSLWGNPSAIEAFKQYQQRIKERDSQVSNDVKQFLSDLSS